MSVSLLSRAEKDKGYVTEKKSGKKNVRITQTQRQKSGKKKFENHTDTQTHRRAHKEPQTHISSKEAQTETQTQSQVTPTQNPPPPKKKTFRPLHLELLKALQNGGVTKVPKRVINSSKTCHK